jgi:hypothetical protein
MPRSKSGTGSLSLDAHFACLEAKVEQVVLRVLLLPQYMVSRFGEDRTSLDLKVATERCMK